MLEQIELTLKEKIKSIFESFDVVSFPTNFKDFSFTSSSGCVLLRYDASAFSNQQSVWQVTQEETYEYTIFLGVRSCYNFEESYPYLEKLKLALQGLQVNGFKVILKKRSFVEEISGDLWWGLIVNLTLPTGETKK